MNKPLSPQPKTSAPVITGILALLLCLLAPARAQNEATVQLQFVSFPSLPEPKTVELRIGETEVMEVNLPTSNLSEVYEVKPMAVWALGKSTVNEEGEPVFETYGQAKSLGAAKQLILVLRKGSADSDGLELIPLVNGTAGFGGGGYLFMNASRVKIGGFLGEEKFNLPPGSMEVIHPKKSVKKGARNVSFVKIFFRNGKEEYTPFFSSEWRYSKTARTLVFIYHTPNTDRLRLHVIRDYL